MKLVEKAWRVFVKPRENKLILAFIVLVLSVSGLTVGYVVSGPWSPYLDTTLTLVFYVFLLSLVPSLGLKQYFAAISLRTLGYRIMKHVCRWLKVACVLLAAFWLADLLLLGKTLF